MPGELVRDGDLQFALGMNSYVGAEALPKGAYEFALNILNRGGALQARPGFDTCYKLPDGELQGFEIFYPLRGLPQQIAVVSGQVYASSYPYKTYRAVAGVTMSAKAKRVHMELAVKSVNRNADGSLTLVANPYSVLMLQDGVSPPSFYDGHTVRTVKSVSSYWPTPQGAIMKAAGGRLWVARRNMVFASDIGDPFTYYEQQYNTLGGVNFYVLPEPVTAFAVTPGIQSPKLLCFTANTTTIFRSDIRNRDLWGQTPDFQYMIFPGVGCVAPWSVTSYEGQLWWYCQTGFTNLDTAQATMQSTKTRFVDNEMVRSRSRLSTDLSGIACAGFSNFLLASVPHASPFNRHTWVMDTSDIDTLNTESPLAWASVWTGVSPVRWATVVRGGSQALYCASADADGHNRVYKAFNVIQRDNGVDFPWRIDLRAYSFSVSQVKRLRFLEYALSELSGQVDIKFSWAGGRRGRYKTIETVSFQAHEGNIDAATIYTADSILYGLKKQSRDARTEEILNQKQDSLTSAGVEGPVYSIEPNIEMLDKNFQVSIQGSGPCAIRAIRLFAELQAEPLTGLAVAAEPDNRFVRFDGGASNKLSDLDAAPVRFTSTKRAEARYGNYVGAATATVRSSISQADADKRALQAATVRANYQLAAQVPPIVGGTAF